MRQYTDLGRRILDEGTWVLNKRTGTYCLTLLNQTLVYDKFPIVTTRKSYWKAAINEMIGYLRGYINLKEFHALGVKTWDANYSAEAWKKSHNRRGEGDLGKIYGYHIRPNEHDQTDYLAELIPKLKSGEDDRGLILNFWRPEYFAEGCLRPCMFQHHFSILDGTLHLTSYQRSSDVPLGLNFNLVQCYFLLHLMSEVSGLKMGKVTHHIINAHVYENQLDLFIEEMSREPLELDLKFNSIIKPNSLEFIDTLLTADNYILEGYNSHPAIAYPFTA